MNSKCAMAEHGHWQTRFVGPCATALQWQGQVAVLWDDNAVRACVRDREHLVLVSSERRPIFIAQVQLIPRQASRLHARHTE